MVGGWGADEWGGWLLFFKEFWGELRGGGGGSIYGAQSMYISNFSWSN